MLYDVSVDTSPGINNTVVNPNGETSHDEMNEYAGGDSSLLLQNLSNKPSSNAGNDRFSTAFLATVIASLGSLNFGYTLGYTSPTELKFEKSGFISKQEFSWFASLIAVGAIIGSIVGAFTVERFGRKSTILMTSLLYAPGWCLISYASNVSMLYIGRICTGIGVGMVSLTVPVYIAEVSSARLRGGFGSINQLFITLGILLAYVIGYQFSWQWTAMVGVILIAVMAITMVFMPETPRWLLAHNRRHNAIKALEWLRGPLYDVEEECFAIESNLDQQESVSLKEFTTPALYKPLIMGAMLMVFQQFCGINVIIFYSAKVLDTAGFKDGTMVSLSVAGTQVIATAVACLVVDKTGRRILLMIGGIAMCLTNLLLGLYFDLAKLPLEPGEKQLSVFGKYAHSIPLHSISWLAVASVIIFIVAFSIGWGPLPWVLMSEIFPTRARGIASGFVTLVNWLFVFIVTNSFHAMLKTMYQQGTFWFFAVFSLLSFVYILMFVPETKGKTLEEIEQNFTGTHEVLHEE